MSFNFAAASSQYLYATAPATAVPLTLACWFNMANVTESPILFALSDTDGQSRFQLVAAGTLAGDPVRVSAFNSAGTQQPSDTTTGFAANTWTHACGVFASDSSRTAYINGGSSATNTNSVTPSGIDNLAIGAARFNSTAGGYMNGSVAEAAAWAAALTAADVAALAKGVSPLKVRPQSLVFYAQLIRQLIDVRGGRSITNSGAATVAAHPRIVY